MHFKQRFDTEKDFLDFVYEFLAEYQKPNFDPEDEEKLKPFFDWCDKGCHPWAISVPKEERKELAEFYKECCERYSDRRSDIKSLVSGIGLEPLEDFFHVSWEVEDSDINAFCTREGLKLKTSLWQETEQITFPCVFVGTLSYETDVRSGCSASFSFSEFVML